MQAACQLLWLCGAWKAEQAAAADPCVSDPHFCRPVHDTYIGATLHVGFVAGGENRQPDLETALISLLRYRSCPLHIHIFADSVVQPRIKAFFAPAEYTQLEYTIYDRPEVEVPKSMWYPQANSKLVMDQVASKDADHLLLMDTDIVVANDICSAHAVFHHMSPEAIMGMAPEMGLFYTESRERQAMAYPSRKSRYRWTKQWHYKTGKGPADSDGLNSGVIFWNLTGARAVNWTGLWQRELPGLLEARNIQGLPNGDQEAFNIVCSHHPQLLEVVPVNWNFQLTAYIWDSKVFDHAMQDVRIFHGNDQRFKQEGHYWKKLADMFASKANDERCADRKRAQQLWSDVRWLDA